VIFGSSKEDVKVLKAMMDDTRRSFKKLQSVHDALKLENEVLKADYNRICLELEKFQEEIGSLKSNQVSAFIDYRQRINRIEESLRLNNY